MSEPSRKKSKSIRPPLVVVKTGKGNQSESNDGSEFTFWTCHPEKSTFVDLTFLAYGSNYTSKAGRGSRKEFSGRPELLRQLMPYIRLVWLGYAPPTVRQNVGSLRTWWQILDQVEASVHEGFPGVKRVVSVTDLSDVHASVARQHKIAAMTHYTLVRVVNLCLKEMGQPPVYWPAPAYMERTADLPEYWEIEKIRHQLKRLWFSTLDRWDEADRIAQSCPTLALAVSTKNCHAGFRCAAGILEDPSPAGEAVWKLLGISKKSNYLWSHLEGAFGRYPSGADVKAAFHLILLASGWNSQTLLDVDVTGKFIEPHPTNPDYHILWGIKNRGNSVHFVLGRNKRSDSPGSILRRLVARTAPLRVKIQNQLLVVEQALEIDPRNTDLLLKRLELRKAAKSPWLFVNGSRSGIVSYLATSADTSINSLGESFLGGIIESINLTLPLDCQIRTNIKASDFRDAYIGFAYEFSNYNILSAQIAATHKSARSTQSYLRQRQWRAHSAKKIRIFTQGLWDEISNTKTVDPAILRGLVERGEVTDEQRTRWNVYKDRTRVGVGCKDFKNPPSYIAPQHVDGKGCRVQRCTLCEHAVVFEDSLDHLARRIAELESLRDSIPVPSWAASSFTDEQEATEAVLQNFDRDLVKSRIAHWKKQIFAGMHRISDMEGAYA